jgi:ribosomal protein S26
VYPPYPDPNSDGQAERVVLHRGVDRYFKCLRCGKALMKDQNMKVHLCQEWHDSN